MKYPIKLNILSKDGDILTKYIFIGDNLDVKKILNGKKITKSGAIILKKYYGAKWKQILCISSYSGGDTTEDTEISEDTEQEITEDNENLFIDDVNELDNNEQHISLEEIYSISNILEEEPEIVVHVNTLGKIVVKYIFEEIILNTFDNILEFKKKIALLTKIPIYKQNISYTHDNKTYNLNYNIYLQNSVVNVSIRNNILNNKSVELINDIPILIKFYNVKNLIKIKTYDTFSILDNFTTNLSVLEFNLFNFDDFITKKNLVNVITNKNQVEIIYYGFVCIFWPMLSFTAWIDYTTNTTADFENIYPEIGINTGHKKRFELEAQITNNAMDLFYDKSKIVKKNIIEKNMYISITDTLIQVKSNNMVNIINLRNLFDSIELNEKIVNCRCSLYYNKKFIILNKTFMDNDQLTNIIPNKCLLLKILGTEWLMLYLYIYPNGNYSIKSKWAEDKLYGFSDVFNIVSETVNNIIKNINNMGNIVITSNYKLEAMTVKNSQFSEISVSLIYRNPIKFYEFKIIENILKEYTNAGIVKLHDIDDTTNILQYYFRKGMYKYKEEKIESSIILNNYYNYLTNHIIKNKWDQLFVQTRNTKFEYRHGDIKISIAGIKQQEFDIFYMYIINIFDMLQTQKKTYIPEKVIKFNLTKNVKTLKYQDPLLYNFKKLYNSQIVYSRICQKKNQPVILNKEEYDSLEQSKKKNAIKYWNFTTKSPAYYQCPNPKYPYIQFTVNKHPKDYCIPCCKIKPVELGSDNETRSKQLIYNTCLETHMYQNETSITSDVRYIMSYGKIIHPGRICNLPEQTIEPLLYESFSETGGLEPKCKNKYYLYGIDQDIKYTKYVGYISTLAFSLDMTIDTLLNETITLLKKNALYFKTLLDGHILKYFKTIESLIDKIETTFLTDTLQNDKKIPWNLIFIDIAYYYFNIISIIFDDLSTQSNTYVSLQLTNKINNTHLQDVKYRSLFLVKKNKVYNPIYDINSTIFFKSKMIGKKLFTFPDPLLNIIEKINEFSIIDFNKNEITLELLIKFIETLKINNDNGKYTITKYFINSHNLCYYVEISTSNSIFYIPVTFSVYVADSSFIVYKPFEIKKYVTLFKHLNSFIKDYNHWVAMISNHTGDINSFLPLEQTVTPLYSYITINKWIYLNNPWSTGKELKPDDNVKNIIGFICNGVNYYHEALAYNYIKTISKAPLERILYHPDVVNANLISHNATVDPRVKNITKNLYDYHLYELLILEYIGLLNKEKNSEIRHLIKKQIIKRTENNSETIITNIKEILQNYYLRYIKYGDLSFLDINKIIEQINEYAINHKDKKKLLEQIDATTYNFDRIKINSFKEMSKPKLIVELTKLSKQIVTIATEVVVSKTLHNVKEFPNMFISCQNNNSDMVYCEKDKLLITRENLTNLLDIMASDILNPFKGKWLFSQLFTDNTITYLKFIRRKNEHIEINVA
jgi:hypothetical protein